MLLAPETPIDFPVAISTSYVLCGQGMDSAATLSVPAFALHRPPQDLAVTSHSCHTHYQVAAGGSKLGALAPSFLAPPEATPHGLC